MRGTCRGPWSGKFGGVGGQGLDVPVAEANRDLAHQGMMTPSLAELPQHLGGIVGKVTTDDVLNEIFGEFCIGK